MKKQIVVNFYGGPGAGKSTQAAKVFAKLKELGINSELITEYAKDLTWQESFYVMKNQLYVFAKQHHRLWRVSDKVQVIVTDSPLLNSLAYSDPGDEVFTALVKQESDKYNNINIFLKRPNSYETHGRTQTLEEAKELDNKITNLFKDHGYEWDMNETVHQDLSQIIVDYIKSVLVRSFAL